jgi:long-chain acyl-CoA synthetase
MAFELSDKVTLPQLVRAALATPRPNALIERVDGVWTPTSSDDVLRRIEDLACAIRSAGLSAGDRVALIAHNSVDWLVADFATVFAGCVVVPVYPTQALDHTAHILQHSGAKLAFVDSQATRERVESSGAEVARIVAFDDAGANGLRAFEGAGQAIRVANRALPGAYEAALHPDDLAIIAYTSGTTGDPKGVMLSHDNVGFDARSAARSALSELRADSPALSVLPFSHIYEHTIAYVYALARVAHYICHEPEQMAAAVRDVRPEIMTAVPRIFDRLLSAVAERALSAGGLQSKLVPWALKTGRRYARAETFDGGAGSGLRLRYSVARALVLRKLRVRLGLDRLRFFVSGSAALHVDTAMTFLGMGLPITQGYGLTEASPVVAASRFAHNRYGCAGQAIEGVELRADADGEILTRGRHVMQGYYRDREATEAAIRDGWLHTGDVGSVDSDGFLHITDRKREIFKTDTGKWVSPARVESAIKRSPFVRQALVVGDGRPYPSALICPNWELVRLTIGADPLEPGDRLAERSDVLELLRSAVAKQTHELAAYERIRRIIIVPDEFSVAGGELSPAMKIKRRSVESRYTGQIAAIYDNPAGVASA